MILRIALKEIKNQPKFSLLFTLNLCVGLIGFLILHAYKASIHETISQRSQAMLTADLSIAARRALTPDEYSALKSKLPKEARTAPVIDFFSMLVSSKRSRLVHVRAVDENFPFYGELKFKNRPLPLPSATLQYQNSAWISWELAQQLALKEGDSLQLGRVAFTVAGVIQEDPSGIGQILALAPRLYIGISQLPSTDLLKQGSTAWYSNLVRLPLGTNELAMAKTLDRALEDPAIRVQTHQNASEQMSRLTKYLNDYLGLASLVAFFLSVAGASYLLRSYLYKRLKDIAILLSLGFSPLAAQSIFTVQMLFLSALAVLPAALISRVLLPWVSDFLSSFFPFALTPVINGESILVALLFSVVGSFLFSLPMLKRLSELNPATLFQEGALPKLPWRGSEVLWFVPALVFYWALAVQLSHSFRVGGFFILALIVCVAFFWGSGSFLLSRLNSVLRHFPLVPKLAFRNLVRQTQGSLSILLSLGLGVGLLNLIVLTQNILQKELAQPQDSALPTYFLFDIQEEQVQPLKQFLQSQGFPTSEMSPLIRARLKSLNGEPFKKDLNRDETNTREEEVERQFRNRGVNLSYRAELSTSETITSGEAIVPGQDPPGISVEQDFAQKLGLKIGDQLEIDIQGVSVLGVIKNLRKIKWTSFQPNFFIQFGEGVLEGAPKTFLTSVPPMAKEKKITFQDGLIENFPNISAVDVSQVVERLLIITSKVSAALTLMAFLCLFTGMVVIASIANHQAQQRRWDTALLKTLGCPFEMVQAISRWEFFAIGIGATFFGLLCALALTGFFSSFVFENDFQVTWTVPIFSLLIVPAACVLTSELATRTALRERPLLLLQNR